jgi:hypothetical protein
LLVENNSSNGGKGNGYRDGEANIRCPSPMKTRTKEHR